MKNIISSSPLPSSQHLESSFIRIQSPEAFRAAGPADAFLQTPDLAPVHDVFDNPAAALKQSAVALASIIMPVSPRLANSLLAAGPQFNSQLQLLTPPSYLMAAIRSREAQTILAIMIMDPAFGKSIEERMQPIKLFISLVTNESGGQVDAKNPHSSATGLLQLMPGTRSYTYNIGRRLAVSSPIRSTIYAALLQPFPASSRNEILACVGQMYKLLNLVKGQWRIIPGALPSPNFSVVQDNTVLHTFLKANRAILFFPELAFAAIGSAYHTEGYYAFVAKTKLSYTKAHVTRPSKDAALFYELGRIPYLFKAVLSRMSKDIIHNLSLPQWEQGDITSEIDSETLSLNAYLKKVIPIRYHHEARGTGRILSPYGMRKSVTLKSGKTLPPRMHHGVDILVNIGQPVFSLSSGLVTKAHRNPSTSSFGRHVSILEPVSGIIYTYAHLSNLIPSAGYVVKKGEIIALSGDTGAVEGPHLHIEARSKKTGESVNPTKWATPPEYSTNAPGY